MFDNKYPVTINNTNTDHQSTFSTKLTKQHQQITKQHQQAAEH